MSDFRNAFPTAIASVGDLITVEREQMRGRIAVTVIALMAAFAVAMIVFVWVKGSTDANVLITGIFTPIIGIVGTVVGFYFGSQDKESK